MIDEIEPGSKLLDIGTGPAKMLEILSKEKSVFCTGVDSNKEMLEEARKKLGRTNINLLHIKAGKPLPFRENVFDYVTICNVLFHLDDAGINQILSESFRVMKPEGKVIVLTPTGNNNLFRLTRKYFSFQNMSIYLWYNATRKQARRWNKRNYLKEYALQNNLKYNTEVVLSGFARTEIIMK